MYIHVPVLCVEMAPEPTVVSFLERLCILVHISGILALGLIESMAYMVNLLVLCNFKIL